MVRTAALMQPAVSLFHRRSPASIALASRHPVPVTSLAGRFPHEAWASFAQEGSYFQGKPNRWEHCLLRLIRLSRTLTAFPYIAKRFFRAVSGLSPLEHQNSVIAAKVAMCPG
jgi:hypothetical protein